MRVSRELHGYEAICAICAAWETFHGSKRHGPSFYIWRGSRFDVIWISVNLLFPPICPSTLSPGTSGLNICFQRILLIPDTRLETLVQSQEVYQSYAPKERSESAPITDQVSIKMPTKALNFHCLSPGCAFEGYSLINLAHHGKIKHIEEEVSSFPCPFKGCYRVGKLGFTRKDRFRDHLKSAHSKHARSVHHCEY